MAYNKDQFRELINSILLEANLHSEAAVELLMMTAAVESQFGTYLKQIKGPARGVFQMEPATEKDIWENYLRYKPTLAATVRKYSSGHPDELRFNLAYGILMARILYLRTPEGIPSVDDKKALASYWKKWYNTHMGKGTVEKALAAYQTYCI